MRQSYQALSEKDLSANAEILAVNGLLVKLVGLWVIVITVLVELPRSCVSVIGTMVFGRLEVIDAEMLVGDDWTKVVVIIELSDEILANAATSHENGWNIV